MWWLCYSSLAHILMDTRPTVLLRRASPWLPGAATVRPLSDGTLRERVIQTDVAVTRVPSRQGTAGAHTCVFFGPEQPQLVGTPLSIRMHPDKIVRMKRKSSNVLPRFEPHAEMWLWVQDLGYTSRPPRRDSGSPCPPRPRGGAAQAVDTPWVTCSLSSKCPPVRSRWLWHCRAVPCSLCLLGGTPWSCHTICRGTFLPSEGRVFILQESHAEAMVGSGEEYPGARLMNTKESFRSRGDETSSPRWGTNQGLRPKALTYDKSDFS